MIPFKHVSSHLFGSCVDSWYLVNSCAIKETLKSLCGGCVLSRVRLLATPWTVTHKDPLSLGCSRQEYWSALPLPSPGDLPNPGIKLVSLAFFTL